MGKTSYDPQTEAAVDLTNCDREPIHQLGFVQPFGCLISTSSDLIINHLSRNCADLLGLDVDSIVGQKLVGLLPDQTLHDLRTKLQTVRPNVGVGRLFAYDALGNGTLFDISVHMSGKSFIFEFEPKRRSEPRDDLAMVQPLIGRVKRKETIDDATREAARGLQLLSGFDRVMVYRFAPDGSGEVVAERCRPEMESFLGLRYPASDIPQQARALYKRNLLRLIEDVDAEVSPIVPEANPKGEPLDLSLAVTRAVSPIHLEYLRNMGVASSMSVSILKDGELWGLFACHHSESHYVDYERRSAIELFAQFFSYELESKLEKELRDTERESRELHDRLMVRLSSGADLIDNAGMLADEISQLLSNDGIAIYSDGRFTRHGHTPNQEEFLSLAKFLNTVPTGEVFATNEIAALYPRAKDFVDRSAGLLAIPISRTPRDYIVFFRREIARSVRWAGNPEKPVEVGPNGARLTPRKSFEAYVENRRGTSQEWTESEIRMGEALRISLIEIVLKLTDEANEQRRSATEKQELLIAELNHRVRNILNLIQGLVAQSKSDANDIASYTKVLDGRIQSLARAHDQLTRQEWTPSPLRKLIEVEVKAFLTGQADRLEITGDSPLLLPAAFSTMALVVHELVTNSAKYGALTDQSGRVSIDLKIADDGALLIAWREIGGPLVKAPQRTGFGSTIIERTVPFELRGTAEVRYKPGGVEADFMIPAPLVVAGTPEEAKTDNTEEKEDTQKMTNLVAGQILVVEDNMVIALQASDILTAEGADHVELSSSVQDALNILDKQTIDLAVLDVNLGDQTSVPVADRLSKQGTPFVLVSGYGDMQSILSNYPDVPVVQKPFTADALLQALQKAKSQ